MPASADLAELTGTTFVIKFWDDFMNISNESYGGSAGMDFELKPFLNYTPYMYLYREVPY